LTKNRFGGNWNQMHIITNLHFHWIAVVVLVIIAFLLNIRNEKLIDPDIGVAIFILLIAIIAIGALTYFIRLFPHWPGWFTFHWIGILTNGIALWVSLLTLRLGWNSRRKK
jgi:hypothetical protein